MRLPSSTARWRLDRPLWGAILRLAGPLILASTGLFLMQLVDGVFLAWYSEDAIAAVGPATLASLILGNLFLGVTGFTGTLVAQYSGAGQRDRIGATVWQGVYVALFTGLLAMAIPPWDRSLFASLGHPPAVYAGEVRYFEIMCWGMPFSLLANAFSGFFTGRGDMRPLMRAQIAGLALNAVLAYALTLGRLGLPALGITGAALATVIAQAVVAAQLAWRFLRPQFRQEFRTTAAWRWDPRLLRRLVRFGLPNGVRFAIELFGWTVFMFFVGRIGTNELAATSIAFRINALAFVPLFGLSEAIRTLVGQAQGRAASEHAAHVTVQGLLIAEAWMLATVPLFLFCPGALYGLFRPPAIVAGAGVVLLRFVSTYCLLDAVNVIVVGALQAAGDTRWTLRAVLVLYAGFFVALAGADHWRLGLYAEWLIATVFVISTALTWLVRFRSGAWRGIRVIEPGPPAVAAM